MPRHSLLLSSLAVVATLALFVGSASAVCLESDQTVSGEFFRSDAVFIGTVLTERTVPEKDGLYDGWVYRLRIKQTFRGSVRESVEVFTENSSGRFPLVVGETYLLFASMAVGRLTITNCGNSGLLSKTKESIPQIRKRKMSGEVAIKVAAAEATRLGYVVEAMKRSVHKYNTPWNDVISRDGTDAYTVERRNKLIGREYFQVYFAPKSERVKGGDIAVFVDSESGEILATYQGK